MKQQEIFTDGEYLNAFHREWNERCMKSQEKMSSMHLSPEFLREQSRRLEEMVSKEQHHRVKHK